MIVNKLKLHEKKTKQKQLHKEYINRLMENATKLVKLRYQLLFDEVRYDIYHISRYRYDKYLYSN